MKDTSSTIAASSSPMMDGVQCDTISPETLTKSTTPAPDPVSTENENLEEGREPIVFSCSRDTETKDVKGENSEIQREDSMSDNNVDNQDIKEQSEVLDAKKSENNEQSSEKDELPVTTITNYSNYEDQGERKEMNENSLEKTYESEMNEENNVQETGIEVNEKLTQNECQKEENISDNVEEFTKEPIYEEAENSAKEGVEEVNANDEKIADTEESNNKSSSLKESETISNEKDNVSKTDVSDALDGQHEKVEGILDDVEEDVIKIQIEVINEPENDKYVNQIVSSNDSHNNEGKIDEVEVENKCEELNNDEEENNDTEKEPVPSEFETEEKIFDLNEDQIYLEKNDNESVQFNHQKSIEEDELEKQKQAKEAENINGTNECKIVRNVSEEEGDVAEKDLETGEKESNTKENELSDSDKNNECHGERQYATSEETAENVTEVNKVSEPQAEKKKPIMATSESNNSEAESKNIESEIIEEEVKNSIEKENTESVENEISEDVKEILDSTLIAMEQIKSVDEVVDDQRKVGTSSTLSGELTYPEILESLENDLNLDNDYEIVDVKTIGTIDTHTKEKYSELEVEIGDETPTSPPSVLEEEEVGVSDAHDISRDPVELTGNDDSDVDERESSESIIISSNEHSVDRNKTLIVEDSTFVTTLPSKQKLAGTVESSNEVKKDLIQENAKVERSDVTEERNTQVENIISGDPHGADGNEVKDDIMQGNLEAFIEANNVLETNDALDTGVELISNEKTKKENVVSTIPETLKYEHNISDADNEYDLSSDLDESGEDESSMEDELFCDYDSNPTELFKVIQAKRFGVAIRMLSEYNDGASSNFIDKDENEHRSVIEQANTWVVRYENDGFTLRWKMLCLHAAVFFKGPKELIQLLMNIAPFSVEARNDQGMLPLHIAFKYHGDLSVIEMIMKAYTPAITIQDYKGRTPLQCFTEPTNDFGSLDPSDIVKMIINERKFLSSYNSATLALEKEIILKSVKERFQEKLTQLGVAHDIKIEQLSAKIKELTQEASGARSACYSLISKNEACLLNEEKMHDHVHSLESYNKKNEEKLIDQENKISSLNAQLDQAKKENSSLQSKYDFLVEEYSVVEKLKKNLENATKANLTLEKTNNVLRKTISDMKSNAQLIEAERDRWRREAASMNTWKSKCEHLSSVKKELQSKLRELTSSYRAISQESQELGRKVESLSLTNEAMQNSLEEMEAKYEKEVDSTLNLKILCEEKEKDLQAKEQELSNAKDDIEQLKKVSMNREKELRETMSKATNKLTKEEELNAVVRKTIASFVNNVESKFNEADKKFSEVEEFELVSNMSKKEKLDKRAIEERRKNVKTTLEKRILDTESKLRNMIDMKARKPRVETLGMAKDLIHSSLEQLIAEHEIVHYERSLWRIKAEEAEEDIDRIKVDHEEKIHKMATLHCCTKFWSHTV